jgi:hypothetical protein
MVAVCVVIINISLGMMFKNNTQKGPRVDLVAENRKQIYKEINNPEYQKTKNGKIMVAIYRMGMCGILGEACTNNPADGEKNFNHSFFGAIASSMTFPYANPPASGVEWVRSGLQNAGFIPNSYATDGIGFSAIRPLASIWTMFRNIAFTLIVLFIVIVGFMIMFRFKINPQTVVTLSNALPRLVITLILISFSFAIGGFLIDLMYIVTIIGVKVVGTTLLPIETQKMFIDSVTTGGTGRLFDLVFWNGDTFQLGPALMSMLPPVINATVRLIATAVSMWLLTKFPPIGKYLIEGQAGYIGTADGLAGPIISIASVFMIGGLAFLFVPLLLSLLILLLTGLLVFFRILFMLFAAYLRIVISIMFAPLILLTGVLPGRNAFSKWFKSLVADLALFPITLIIITLSSAILAMNNNFQNIWQPPFLYTGVNQNAFNVLVAIGLMYMIPDIGKLIREFFGIKGSPLKFGFGTFLMGGTVLSGGAMGGLGKYSQIKYTMGPLLGKMDRKGPLGWIPKMFSDGGGSGGGHVANEPE